MTGYSIRAHARCSWPEVASATPSIASWCWAGHDGLVLADALPDEVIPTSHLWGWGTDVWVRWRVDAIADCVGAELRVGGAAGFERATERSSPDEMAIRSEEYMLRWAPGSGHEARFLSTLTILAPVALVFWSLGPAR